MNGRELQNIAGELLALLDEIPAAAAEKTRFDGTPEEHGIFRALPRTAEEAEVFQKTEDGAGVQESLFRRNIGQTPEAYTELPFASRFFSPDGREKAGTEDAMEYIDNFFRRDSRRYDGGFDTV